jgi:hypothetical protein
MASDRHPRPIRANEFIRRDCVRKLRLVKTSNMFMAILASLLEEDWTTPSIQELRITPDHRLLGRIVGAASFKAFRCAESGLIRNLHGIAEAAGLDGDELGYMLGRVAKIKAA